MDARVTNEEILLHLNPLRSPLARLADGLRAVWWALCASTPSAAASTSTSAP
jgi:hypothetical protein